MNSLFLRNCRYPLEHKLISIPTLIFISQTIHQSQAPPHMPNYHTIRTPTYERSISSPTREVATAAALVKANRHRVALTEAAVSISSSRWEIGGGDGGGGGWWKLNCRYL